MKPRVRLIAAGIILLLATIAVLLIRLFHLGENWQWIVILFAGASILWWLTYGIGGVSCRGCMRGWSTIKQFEHPPSTWDKAMMHAYPDMCQGYVCTQCATIICERCFFIGNRTCPSCGCGSFSDAWLREKGPIDVEAMRRDFSGKS